MYVLMLVCMYEFYLDLLSVNTFIIEKCDVLKENGEKSYKSIFGSSLYFKVSKKSNLGLIKITKMLVIVIHLNTLLNLFI